MTTFIRSEDEDGTITCSWYNKNGKRYRIESTGFKGPCSTARECDNLHGFMAYALLKGFEIRDDAPLPHPKQL